MASVPITVKIDSSFVGEQITHDNQTLEHELEVFIICPNITVLLFFKGSSIRGGFPDTSYINFFLIVCFAIKWRIDVNQINLPTKFLQKMAHDLEVVSPENLVDPSVLGITVRFPQLCRIILRGAVGTLARPAKFREPLYRRSLFKFKSKLLIHGGYPPFYRFLGHIRISRL